MKDTIEIPFEPSDAVLSLTLELDDEKNAGRNTFIPGSDVWIRAITDKTLASRDSTLGTLKIDTLHLRFDHEQELAFIDTNETTLEYEPLQILSYGWIGIGLGKVTFNGKTARAATSGYGILQISYRVAFARLRLEDVNEAGPVLVWAQDVDGKRGYLQIEFEHEEEGAEEEVFVTVKNYCTDNPIPGASVELDGEYKGVTDAYGRLSLGLLARGSKHDIRTTAPGFKNSDVDALANDEFTVN